MADFQTDSETGLVELERQGKPRSYAGVKLRRQLLTALGCRDRLGLRAKVTIGAMLFIVSFSIKSLVAVDLSPTLHTNEQFHAGMAGEYYRDALSILRGHGLLVPDNHDPADTSLLVHSPGYGMVMAAIFSARDGSYFTIQLFQNLLNSIAVILIFLIAGGLISWRVGVVAGLLTALSHHFSFYSNVILPDSICGFPLLIAVYMLVRNRHGRPRPVWFYAIIGLLVGLSVWLRPNALLMGPVLLALLALALPRRRLVRSAWAIAVVPFLVIAPITIRNYLIFGEFVLVSANVGIVLWEGIGDASGDRFGAVTNDVLVARQEAELYNDPRYGEHWAKPDGIMRDRDRVKKSLKIIANNPVWFAGAMLDRMTAMVRYSSDAPLVFRASDTKVIEAGRRINEEGRRNDNVAPRRAQIEADQSVLAIGRSIWWMRPVARGFQRVAKETALPMVLIGAAVMLWASRVRFMLLMLVPLYYLLVQSLMHTEFRYTLPMHYFLFVFAAVAWGLLGLAVYSVARRMIVRWKKCLNRAAWPHLPGR